MATVLAVLKVAQNSFSTKDLNKGTAQMALFLVRNESATAKIALSQNTLEDSCGVKCSL